MRLQRLAICNIGPFHGLTEFDLSVNTTKSGKAKNVVLLGGKNGCGKTNILESLRLCLYGKRGLGPRLSEAQYRQEIINRLHRKKGIRNAYSEVEFLLPRNNLESTFVVKRSWAVTGDSISEEMTISENGHVLSTVPEEFWQNFLDEIMPPNLAQLFFFDGERIQELASDNTTDATHALIEAVESLFGLSLINRLVADLNVVERQISAEGGSENAKKIAVLHEEQSELRNQLTTLQKAQLKVLDKSEREKTQQLRLEEKMKTKGGSFAKKREEIAARKERALTKLEQMEISFREKADDLFPFTLCSGLVENLRAEVEENQDILAQTQAKDLLEKKAKTLQQAFTTQALARLDKTLDAAQKTKLKGYIEGLVSQIIGDDAESEARTMELSLKDFNKILSWVDDLEKNVPSDLRKIALEMEISSRELTQAEADAEKAPKNDELAPIFEDMKLVSEKLGSIFTEQQQLDEQQRVLQNRLMDVERQLKKLADSVLVADEMGLVFARSIVAKEVAKKFGVALTEKKLDELAVKVQTLFNELARKHDVVNHVKIDPKTYEMSVFTRHGGIMPKDRFSAGERQILAISILWALAQMSGKALPMVIDTPLGRLDSEHREKLVKNYFTKASHQVIILSTDEEVDEKFYEMIRPSLAHTYHLVYDSKKLETNVQSGYFWS